MAALRRGGTFLGALRSSSRFLFISGKVCKWRCTVYRTVACLTVGGGLCAVPFTQIQSLSHESLIKRAASLVTDSSSTFLSQSTLALIEAITDYSKAVHTLIALQSHYISSMGKLTPPEEDSIWQLIIGQRAEVSERQEKCKLFESTWIRAINLCETAAEAAYSSGAEQATITVQTNIQVAQSQVEEARRISQDADKKLSETKVMEIERISQYAASLENSIDEEDVPEAYLRED